LKRGFDYTAAYYFSSLQLPVCTALSGSGHDMTYWRDGLAAVETEARGLSQLAAHFERQLAQPFDEAIAQILKIEGRVIVGGIGKSGHIARKFAATLSSTGTPSQFIHPSEASHGDLGAVTVRDAVVLISNSGESGELSAMIEHCKRFDILLIAITARADGTLARNAKIVLLLPKVEEACPNGLAPTSSTTLQLALCDAIAVSLLKSRRFMPADFSVYHPGGQLGAQIRTVSSLMHKGEELPLVPIHLSMREAIVEMSGKGFGIIGIVDGEGRLKGVISDGDLRRHIADEGLLDLSVERIMTNTPRVIDPEALVMEAARNMQVNNISALFVLDRQGYVAGLIRLSDLLRSGVV
jgi:arabinose-5-phosphate isomerase